MPIEQTEPFADNWAYLRAELLWVDRVLSLAIARQRKDSKDLDRVGRSAADRVTSHWWKGLVSLEGTPAGDSPVETPSRTPGTPGFQQQLQAKIQISQQREILLGLPSLVARLQLSTLEKNLVLLTLVPEISRRYGQIFHYLQEEPGAGLPTIDLLLRLLCRTDADWRSARAALTPESPLIQHHVLQVVETTMQPFLLRRVRLTDSCAHYLLAEQPRPETLEQLIQTYPSQTRPNQTQPSQVQWLLPSEVPIWERLVLPKSLLESVQHLCTQMQVATQVDQAWGFDRSLHPSPAGQLVLLAGAPGTGKTMAAQAIAQTLQLPLVSVDLALLSAAEMLPLLQELQRSPLLLLKSAQVWLGRSALPEGVLERFFSQRQQFHSLTLLSVTRSQTIQPRWRRRLHPLLEFPMPDPPSQVRLWQQAFSAEVPLDRAIEWQTLAQQYSLTGGEINTIAREAAIFAAADPVNPLLGLSHLLRACEWWQGRSRKK